MSFSNGIEYRAVLLIEIEANIYFCLTCHIQVINTSILLITPMFRGSTWNSKVKNTVLY